jgi:hypothetical protein
MLLLRLAFVVSIVCASTGCGPVISTYLIVSAQADLDGARAAEAEKYAVYEYTAASEYLHKAREEQGYADFGPSIDFAYKAQDLAEKATTRAQEEKKRQSEQPGNPEWQAPQEEGQQPSVIIKKKPDADVKVKVVPIPTVEGPKPK